MKIARVISEKIIEAQRDHRPRSATLARLIQRLGSGDQKSAARLWKGTRVKK